MKISSLASGTLVLDRKASETPLNLSPLVKLSSFSSEFAILLKVWRDRTQSDQSPQDLISTIFTSATGIRKENATCNGDFHLLNPLDVDLKGRWLRQSMKEILVPKSLPVSVGLGFLCVSIFTLPLARGSTQQQPQVSEAHPLVERKSAVDHSDRLRYEYKLGPDDVITVQVADDESFKGKPIRLNSAGTVTLPLIGRVMAADKTAAELEDQITTQLGKYMVAPQVSVSITEYRSQPISVLGAVNKPGIYQLEGPRTIAQMLAIAGGVAPDAGYQLRITRETRWGTIPISGALSDEDQKFNSAKVELNSIADGTHPADNVEVKPFDVLFVPKGEMVYVMGEVTKAGGFVLHDHESMTVLEAVSLAGGYSPRAAPKKAKILRSIEGQDHRQEVDLNLKAVESGQMADIKLMPRDVLVVPNDRAREIRMRAIETAVALGTGILIFRR